MSDSSAKPVLLGIVGGAHGLKGECRVSSFTADPCDLGAYGPLFDAAGNRYTVRSARPQKNVVVVRFAEVRDRDHAERLNGRELFVARDALPEEDDAGDFYVADLVGLAVVTLEGEAVGEVVAAHDFGAGDVLEIRPERGPTVMIPFSEAAVPEVDLEAGRIKVEPVAAGLASTERGEEDEPEPAA
ncbi:ribosome maturation factor RimM [Aureimonas leprariae]|uniref:Ribosome maturation factor RimM n=1 Tax=Plantimonas leprariae TaxID=2615207 RepID=A0A7V7PRA9_9HYPH|nr:ribosome maturation factor RimM [Aureimonas leprariae]KAB0681210.1 ribosome maturation factor RimM [Aureimonas leprariae]